MLPSFIVKQPGKKQCLKIQPYSYNSSFKLCIFMSECCFKNVLEWQRHTNRDKTCKVITKKRILLSP